MHNSGFAEKCTGVRVYGRYSADRRWLVYAMAWLSELSLDMFFLVKVSLGAVWHDLRVVSDMTDLPVCMW